MSHRKAKKIRRFLKEKGVNSKEQPSLYKALKRVKTSPNR